MIAISRTLVGGVVLAGLGMGLVACKSAPAQQTVAAPIVECPFPGSTTPAPLWVCDNPVEGYPLTAVGTYEKTAAGIQFQKEQAAAGARTELATRMRVQVQNMVKRFIETTGAGTSETVDKVNTSVGKQITNESLVGSTIIRSITSPDGSLYVLVALKPEQIQQAAEQALKTSMNNEKALWQKFQAGKAQDELAAEIAKQTGEFTASK